MVCAKLYILIYCQTSRYLGSVISTKITNLEIHICQNVIAMVTVGSRRNSISYQIIPSLSLDN